MRFKDVQGMGYGFYGWVGVGVSDFFRNKIWGFGDFLGGFFGVFCYLGWRGWWGWVVLGGFCRGNILGGVTFGVRGLWVGFWGVFLGVGGGVGGGVGWGWVGLSGY